MECLITYFYNYWCPLAITFSFAWGVYGAYFFTRPPMANSPDDPSKYIFRKYLLLGTILEGTYQFVFYFIGSFAGWSCFYILISRLNGQSISTRDFTGGDLVLFTLSLLGLTGYLPKALYSIVQAITSILERIASKVVE